MDSPYWYEENMKKEFMKYDTDKPRVSLVDPMFILGTAEVLTFGAKKYEVNNWKKLPYKELWRVQDSLLRHTMSYLDGEYIDEESGLEHLKHIACNVMFLLHHENRQILKDMDAPSKKM